MGYRIKAFAVTIAQVAGSPASQTGNAFGYPGATPSITTNGTSNAVLRAAENGGGAVLLLTTRPIFRIELFNSTSQYGGRDQFGTGNKFSAPMVTNGKVHVGTTNGVGVFGLLH